LRAVGKRFISNFLSTATTSPPVQFDDAFWKRRRQTFGKASFLQLIAPRAKANSGAPGASAAAERCVYTNSPQCFPSGMINYSRRERRGAHFFFGSFVCSATAHTTLSSFSLCADCLFNVHQFYYYILLSYNQGDQSFLFIFCVSLCVRCLYFLVTFVSSPRLSLLPVFFLIAKRSRAAAAVAEGITRKRNNGCRWSSERERGKERSCKAPQGLSLLFGGRLLNFGQHCVCPAAEADYAVAVDFSRLS
jgi:hypothetical protein